MSSRKEAEQNVIVPIPTITLPISVSRVQTKQENFQQENLAYETLDEVKVRK